MTDIVPFTPTWVEIISPSVALAERIAKTEFVPKALQGRPEAVLAAILTGHEIGIGPMAALAKIVVIEGRPTMAAELMRALGFAAGHEAWVEESTTTRVVIAGRRHGSQHVTKVTWTLDDARKAGLAGRQNWQRYPRQMLLARATAELARLIWPDALGGIAYATEELADLNGQTVDPTDQLIPAPVETKRRRKTPSFTPRPAPEPPAVIHDLRPLLPDELEDQDDEPGQPSPATMTNPQRNRIHATFRDLGIFDRRDRLTLAAGIIDHPLESSSQLTVDEASQLIDTLEAIKNGRARITLDNDARPTGIQWDNNVQPLLPLDPDGPT